jgi:hypothetical protein
MNGILLFLLFLLGISLNIANRSPLFCDGCIKTISENFLFHLLSCRFLNFLWVAIAITNHRTKTVRRHCEKWRRVLHEREKRAKLLKVERVSRPETGPHSFKRGA